MKKIICERLKELRTEKGYSQKQVADMLKIDRSNYSKYELGKLDLNTDMLINICKLYSVSSDYILGLEL